MLRALAALGVVVHHCLEQSNGARNRVSPDWLTTCGASGVDVFFVISGFIMLYVSFSRPAPLGTKAFILRRWKRIFPIYWVCCLAMLCMHQVGFLKGNPISLYDIFASFALLPGKIKLINVSWTLVYEMYFYLLFAATLRLRSASASVLLSTLGIACLAALSHFLPSCILKSFLENPIPLEFCMGLGLALIFLSRKNQTWPRWTLIGFAGFMILAIMPLFVPHPNTNGLPNRVVYWGVPAAFIVAAGCGIGQPKNLAAKFLVVLGDASYSLYLTQEFIMIIYGWLLKKTFVGGINQAFVIPLVIGVCICFGLATHHLIERPLVALLGRGRVAAVAAA